jgi:hypothetical protein
MVIIGVAVWALWGQNESMLTEAHTAWYWLVRVGLGIHFMATAACMRWQPGFWPGPGAPARGRWRLLGADQSDLLVGTGFVLLQAGVVLNGIMVYEGNVVLTRHEINKSDEVRWGSALLCCYSVCCMGAVLGVRTGVNANGCCCSFAHSTCATPVFTPLTPHTSPKPQSPHEQVQVQLFFSTLPGHMSMLFFVAVLLPKAMHATARTQAAYSLVTLVMQTALFAIQISGMFVRGFTVIASMWVPHCPPLPAARCPQNQAPPRR